MNSRRSMRPWGTLTEEVKAANRSQAADIGTKLGAIGCVLAPNPIWGQPERLGQSDIESLAVQEHRRWCGWMAEHGWQHGSEYNEDEKRHPDLVPWNALGESCREKDRNAVRALPEILDDAGFQIVRIQPRVAAPRSPEPIEMT